MKDVRDLDSVVTKTGAAIGVLISIEEPTKPMREWAANTGSYTSLFNGQKYPRLQLRTIGQLMAGMAIERPSGNVAVDETFKKAPKAKAKGAAHPELELRRAISGVTRTPFREGLGAGLLRPSPSDDLGDAENDGDEESPGQRVAGVDVGAVSEMGEER